jgi:hypothetical protein
MNSLGVVLRPRRELTADLHPCPLLPTNSTKVHLRSSNYYNTILFKDCLPSRNHFPTGSNHFMTGSNRFVTGSNHFSTDAARSAWDSVPAENRPQVSLPCAINQFRRRNETFGQPWRRSKNMRQQVIKVCLILWMSLLILFQMLVT